MQPTRPTNQVLLGSDATVHARWRLRESRLDGDVVEALQQAGGAPPARYAGDGVGRRAARAATDAPGRKR